MERPSVCISNTFRPPWMRGDYSWSRPRIAWRCRIRAPRPIWFFFVCSGAITEFRSGRATRRRRPIRRPRDSDFGDGRLREVRHATDTLVRVARSKGKFTAFTLGADIPGLLRRGAPEVPGGHLDFSRDLLTLDKRGVSMPKRVNRMGQRILRVVDSGEDPPREVERPSGFGVVLRSGFYEQTYEFTQRRDASAPRRGWPVSVLAPAYIHSL